VTPYYDDGTCVIYHGDCRDHVPQWAVGGGVMVTDPPYGIKWPAGAMHSNRSERDASTPSIVGDADTAVRDWVLGVWGDRPSIVFGSWRMPRPSGTTHRMIWHKTGRHPGVAPAPIFPTDEEIYVIGSGWVGRPPRGTVITTHEQRALQPKLIGHPTPKPIDLMQSLIELCRPMATIVDPFMGSGSTLVAAKTLRRRCVGVEIDERYCEIAAKRLAQEVLDFEVSA
jgi:hypothetical protein